MDKYMKTVLWFTIIITIITILIMVWVATQPRDTLQPKDPDIAKKSQNEGNSGGKPCFTCGIIFIPFLLIIPYIYIKKRKENHAKKQV